MKKIRYIILMALCAIGMSACQDDLIENASTGGADASKPVKVDLKFGIPKSMEVEVTRADNSYSGMYGARLYVFSGKNLLGEPQQKLTDDNTLTANGSATDNGQYYTAHDVTLYEGTQTVYAVGNITRTGYWDSNTLTVIDAAAEQGLDAFEAALYNLSSTTIENRSYPSFSTQYMPLSGSGEVTVTDGSAGGTVELKRLVAQIKFEIMTLYKTNDKTVTFEPSNYTFHNIATQAYVLGGKDKTILTTEVYDANPVNISGAGSDNIADFSVFIPENIQNAKRTGAGGYDDRESFSREGDEKNWMYAPDNGTYVVISGVCTEKDNTGKLLRYGNVEYIIHMGDFSRTTGSNDDFSVERNCIYTYKVSVHGMDKIEVEAKKKEDDYQNGAEGDVIELGTGSKTFSLDAHYEQVFVEYNLSDILDNVKELHPDKASADAAEVKQDIANQFRLVIHTPMNTVDDKVILPYNSENDEATDMAGIDYKWVEFYPQTADNTISLYPGKEKTEEGKKLYSPYQVCQMMGEAIYALYQDDSQTPSVEGLDVQKDGSDYVARFTIFVDEYFYTEDLNGTKVAWDKFTRQDPRTMMIASDMEISDDLNSTYSIAQTYITQRAIQTFYNPDAASYYNALGIETYNETGVISLFSPQHRVGDVYHSDIPVSDDQSKGRDNMLKNMGIIPNNASATDANWTKKNWNTYINFANVGYTDDNSNSNNRWSGEWNAQTASYAYYACMSRNRDLNGDGEINPSEVRWYLPALSQYLRIGIGKNALPAETRLFTGDASTMTGDYPNDYLEQGALYYTNTSIDDNPDLAYSIYWAVEVGAYGAQNRSAMVRCVRNLPNQNIVDNASSDDDIRLVNRDAWAGPVYDKVKTINNGDNYLFDFGDRLVAEIFRNSEKPQYGPYDPHNEEDVDEMMLPNAFVVAERELYVRYNLPQIPLGTYSNRAEYDRTDVGHNATFDWSYSGWGDDPCSSYYENNNRSERGYWRTPSLNELMVMSTVDGLLLEDENTYSRTQFTQPKREIFYYNASGFITTSANEDSSPGYIRCVRDATQAERAAVQ